ncbi:proteasome subunit alpha type-2 [Skeletonema marinoi]|uniref:Proteasome subunit alpha type-2 n=2 Tax=Skeletonema marinoi TaxID=267567 RepID=A0AAD8XXH5_9STRA|nr:proteasome subunit alpha type-2 [Skeletonema marinoi]|mmetsp:Transcript_989/g.2093  ORF Transcript_989/g.2093 Transcript_989/m.2093 type:complete len:238 (-) Transcript_989:352-1065(-)|eukprot:CAMPEP_0113431696 /NCGR_PEP_ID=MMETSP0013_2-20120614/33725_1 /TAXON_ID=2843 ORGANISM="Skeletonema costatum, Strain 1716" /NCGR_SAMPLE_ID=MMETSP0013_2 /ASSEMBLY_ACC=CAM_ASM_000158 /LENGTH=237 /DNA_ID=CAMNT_0000320711 /DNA_START=50 /DNA_END=763 /DNA_ORIENTATION=+ /assembly_acc=CAM_ASM_000158
MGDSAYSFSLTTFSRTGKLLQIEYALNAVANGRTALGIAATDGVVIATDKKFASSLVEGEGVQKVERITKGSGFVYSGVGPDYRVLVRKGRKSAQAYYREYNETKPVGQLVKSTASVMQEYTQSGGVRPFGVSLLVAGIDSDGSPRLFQVDPSGAYFGWKATAIGKNYVNAKNFLEKRYQEDMELEDAIHTALLTLREGFEGEMNGTNIEVGVVSKSDGVFRLLTPEQIQDYLDEAN